MADKQAEGPDEAIAVTGRPQDEPLPNTTLADRLAARQPKRKAVQSSENKSAAGKADSK